MTILKNNSKKEKRKPKNSKRKILRIRKKVKNNKKS